MVGAGVTILHRHSYAGDWVVTGEMVGKRPEGSSLSGWLLPPSIHGLVGKHHNRAGAMLSFQGVPKTIDGWFILYGLVTPDDCGSVHVNTNAPKWVQ